MVRRKQWSGLAAKFEKPVMFISDMEELTAIRKDGDYINIGAACTLTQLIDNSLIPDFCKIVFQEMASPAIRNVATIGGNICNSSPAGDSLPLLYALDASVVVENRFRWREIPIEEFITGPGQNILNPNEIVSAIRLPIESFDTFVYRKVGTRKACAISKLSFAALAKKDDGKLKDVRIAFGAAAPVVIRCRDVEEEIISMYNKGLLEIEEIIKYYEPLFKPIDDQRSTASYRKKVCKRLLEDFLKNISTGGVR